MIKRIGIIGFGQMGKIFTDIFSEGYDVLIFNRSPVVLDAKTLRAKVSTLDEACKADVVIFCLPVQSLEKFFQETSRFLKKDTVVLDITSIKEKTANLMLKAFPKNIQLLGTHPMFGPNSLKESNQKNIVFCPVKITPSKLVEVESVFIKAGFTIFKMTPKQHDRRMARSQLLVHLTANLTKKLKVKDLPFAPYSFRSFLKSLAVADSSPKLVKNLVVENKFSKDIITKMIIELAKLKRQLPEN